MASYSIGDESDDDFDLQQRGGGAHGAGSGSSTAGSRGGAGLAPVSSRQAHQYIDPFDDDFASAQPAQQASSNSGVAGGATARPYDDALIFDDFTGGKPANPLGTASDVRDPHGASDFSRYDVYDE